MQRGDQPVHAKLRSLTFSDFEYICTIPKSGIILPCFPIAAQPFRLFSFPFTPTGTALQFAHLSALLCAIFSFHQVVPANCLLLNLLCCALKSRTSFSSNSLCVSIQYQLQAPYSWINVSLMQLSCSAMRPQQTTKINCSVNAYHSCSLYIAVCKPPHPLSCPHCLTLGQHKHCTLHCQRL